MKPPVAARSCSSDGFLAERYPGKGDSSSCDLPSGSQSLEPLCPSKGVRLYSHLSLTTPGYCRVPTSPAGAPFGLAEPFRGIG
jgi:hypothetical protein